MWSLKQTFQLKRWRMLARLGVVLVAAGLTAGCFQPLYGRNDAAPDSESVHDKLAEVEIPAIVARQGSSEARIAVAMRNALQYDFNNGAGATAPTHRLVMKVGASSLSVLIDQVSGRPTAELSGVTAHYQLIEIATGKVVLTDMAYAHVDTDNPGSQQRFAQQRAQRDAEDRAVIAVAEAIRTRLASYFVAGT